MFSVGVLFLSFETSKTSIVGSTYHSSCVNARLSSQPFLFENGTSLKKFLENSICGIGLHFIQGPFTTFKVENEAKEDWTGLKFSPDGKMIMITTNGSSVTLIDSFKGTLVHVLRGLFICFDNCPRQKVVQTEAFQALLNIPLDRIYLSCSNNINIHYCDVFEVSELSFIVVFI